MISTLARPAAAPQVTQDRTRQTFVVTGPHGTLTVDAETGSVLDLWPFYQSDAYADIVRIDAGEWVAFWASDPRGSQLDIQDVGFWTASTYQPADAEWREEVRPVRLDRQLRTGSAVYTTNRR